MSDLRYDIIKTLVKNRRIVTENELEHNLSYETVSLLNKLQLIEKYIKKKNYDELCCKLHDQIQNKKKYYIANDLYEFIINDEYDNELNDKFKNLIFFFKDDLYLYNYHLDIHYQEELINDLLLLNDIIFFIKNNKDYNNDIIYDLNYIIEKDVSPYLCEDSCDDELWCL